MLRRAACRAAAVAVSLAGLAGCSMLWGNVEPERGTTSTIVIAVQPYCGDHGHGPRPPFGANPKLDSVATAIDSLPPRSPEIAREAGVHGTVIIAALVCEHGNVVDERVRKSIPMLDSAARSCAAQWHFRPAVIDGRPVASWKDIQVRFLLH